MPFYSTPAVVLNSEDSGELDKMVTLFTRDFGKLKGIAKGAKKSKKRFGANLDLFAYVNAIFFEGHSPLVRIEETSFIQPFRDIISNLVRFSYASYFVQLIHEMTKERQKEESIFEHLVYFLTLLNNSVPKEDMLRIFEIRLLAILGLKPRLDACLKCLQLPNSRKRAWFSISKGGMLCSKCSRDLDNVLPISYVTLKVLGFVQSLNLRDLAYLSLSKQVLSESEQILPDFIRYHLGKKIKAGEFINRLTPC